MLIQGRRSTVPPVPNPTGEAIPSPGPPRLMRAPVAVHPLPQGGEGGKLVHLSPQTPLPRLAGPVPLPAAASNEKLNLEANRQGTPRNSFTELITSNKWGLWFMLTAALIAAALGGLHALEPGHGKTIVAAYLVGSQGTPAHALLLGLIVTATHTAGVYALGLITLYASKYIVPDHLYPWLGVASGLIIAFLGLYMLRRRLAGHQHAETIIMALGVTATTMDILMSTPMLTPRATTSIHMCTPTSTIMTLRKMPGTRIASKVLFLTDSL